MGMLIPCLLLRARAWLPWVFRAAREFLGESSIIGRSTHHVDEALHAADEGADYVCFGPVYATPSKMQYGEPQGIEKLRELCQKSPIPVFAIGGITIDHVNEVMETGAFGIAVISAVFQSKDITGTIRGFQESIEEYYT